MADIEIRKTNGGEDESVFEVLVSVDGGETRHRVSLPGDVFGRLKAGAESEEEFIRRCFVFLLEREPKESILGEFDVTDISGYFPEFESEISL